MDKDVFRKQSGYVMQSDALFPLLTVRETIQYAASLRCIGTIKEKNNFAENTIKLLKLDDCADTIIGDNDNRGLSGIFIITFKKILYNYNNNNNYNYNNTIIIL